MDDNKDSGGMKLCDGDIADWEIKLRREVSRQRYNFFIINDFFEF